MEVKYPYLDWIPDTCEPDYFGSYYLFLSDSVKLQISEESEKDIQFAIQYVDKIRINNALLEKMETGQN